MSSSRFQYMLEAPVVPLLMRLSTPNIAIVLAQTSSVIADAWFVGQIGTNTGTGTTHGSEAGTIGLASLAVVYPMQALMQMMSAGAMGGGISSAVARAMGRGQRQQAAALAVHALIIGLVMAAIYALVAGVFARELFALLGARGEVLDGAVRYAHIMFGAGIALWLTNTLASLLRGSGNMLLPGIVLVGAQLLHIVLCGALTLGWGSFPALGVAGPALAFVISFTLAGLVLAGYVLSGKAGLHIHPRTTQLRAEHFHDILKVGVVACLNALLTIATVFIVTRLVATQGTAALAGYGLGSRLELLLVPLTFGIGAALTASVGANFGAQQYARARRVAMTGAAAVFVLTGGIGVIAALAPELWLTHFSADAEVHAMGTVYLGIVGPWYGFFGLGMALYFASQGTGNMLWPLGAGALRLLVAAGGASVASVWMGLGVHAIFMCVACGLLVFGTTVAASLKARHWNPERSQRG